MNVEALTPSLLLAAAGVGFIHTALGPDHYLPFLMLARVRGWSWSRTVAVTAACGLGHVASSLVLGGAGILLGLAVGRVEDAEGIRGSLAAYALIAFGLAYAVWGLRHALRRSRGLEPHDHHGLIHMHSHGDEPHSHASADTRSEATFWALFAIFVLGPCEPLIPIFVLPASRGYWGLATLAAAVFGVVTLASMIALTLLGLAGAKLLRLHALERWSHTLAGCIIAATGVAVIVLGI